MVHLEALLQAPEDGDGVGHARRLDQHLLEATLEGGVLLHVLAELLEGGRADAMQLAAGEHGLEEVGRVHRAVGLTGADQRVHLVDEQEDPALGVLHLGQHRLETFLELAAVLGAGEQGAQVEGEHRLVAQTFGHVAVDDALRQALDHGGLADAGFADEHGVVLRAAGKDADDAADLLVPADHRIHLAGAGAGGEVHAVLLERLVGRLGIGGGHALGAADGLEGAEDVAATEGLLLEGRAERRGLGQGEQHVLGGHKGVLHGLGLLLRLQQQLMGIGGEVRLAGALGEFGKPGEDAGGRRGDRLLVLAGAAEQGRRDPAVLGEERDEHVGGLQGRVATVDRLGRRELQRLGGLVGQVAVRSSHRTEIARTVPSGERHSGMFFLRRDQRRSPNPRFRPFSEGQAE